MIRFSARLGLSLCFLAALVACSTVARLAAPPNLYIGVSNYPADGVSEVLRSTSPQIFYVTDRAAERSQGVVTGYGTARSAEMAFGAATVQFGAADWNDLVKRTSVENRQRLSRLDVTGVSEMVRFSATPLPDERRKGALAVLSDAAQSYGDQTRAVQDALSKEIARTGNARILIYVHGVSNEFGNAVTTLANLRHFAGRGTIPIAFTWPAGNRGPLGYFRDRAAGDFSVYHAKELLWMLAAMPEVEDNDIVAHSRGSDVMTQALRELIIFQRGRGVPPKIGMKTGTLILAAADLDTGIVQQRLLSERFLEAFEQVNIYVNPADTALRLSSFLTKSPRIGALTEGDFDKDQLARLAKEGLIHFIKVEGAGGSDSHSYFRGNPAVLSDIVLALRPLEADDTGVWLLQPNYPLERLPDLGFEAPG